MSEKVVITKAQAEAIELNKEAYTNGEILNDYFEDFSGVHWSRITIRRMDIDDLVKSLYIGYEVEPEFGVGDWVVYKSNIHDEPITRKVIKINEHIGGATLDKESIVAPFDLIRHATPSEIAEEKERRFWKKLGRKPKQYFAGDVIRVGEEDEKMYTVVKYAGKHSVEDIDFDYWSIEDIVLVCAAENRLDISDE